MYPEFSHSLQECQALVQHLQLADERSKEMQDRADC